jgi:prepilin-type processing-associated H-X9-DG protein
LTLIETLVVVGILAALLGLILPGVQRVRESASRMQCGSNLRQIGLGLHGYHDTYRVLPPGIRVSTDPYPFLGWPARLLPYVEQQALWQQAQKDYAQQPRFWDPPAQHAGLRTVLPLFICPSDGRRDGWVMPEDGSAAFTHYLGVIGRNIVTRDGLLYLDSQVALRDVLDGTSNTLMVGERPPSPDNRFGWWYAGVGQEGDGDADMILGVEGFRTTFRYPTCPIGPYHFSPGQSSNVCDTLHFWSQHSGGAYFLFADGSLHFLSYSAAPLMPALASRAGREAVTLPD